ncbi:hypothetical protein OsI_34094 [Oryza sativa Indica Group]|nr:hypothetical protein OsI_34094 [Oryza sativa Indica Group]
MSPSRIFAGPPTARGVADGSSTTARAHGVDDGEGRAPRGVASLSLSRSLLSLPLSLPSRVAARSSPSRIFKLLCKRVHDYNSDDSNDEKRLLAEEEEEEEEEEGASSSGDDEARVAEAEEEAAACGGGGEAEMSYLLPHLHSGWAVDQAILAEEERLVIIRFGHDWDETCMQMDEVLAAVAETIKNFAVIYLVDITEVPDFNTMYELYDPSTVMFFFRNKHIMIDLGTGNNNKINWALKDKQEFIDIVETVYRGARKGRGLVIAPKDYSTKYRY